MRTACAALVALGLLLAIGAGAPSPRRVGTTTRRIVPAGAYEWRGSRDHALHLIVWYPAPADVVEVQLSTPPNAPLWIAGRAAAEAPIARGRRYPLVVLSHGTGGSAFQLGWLGVALARRGFVVAAVDHPGNSAVDTYTPEGFVLRWERARDLRAAIDGVLQDPVLGKAVDPKRIGAAGFSLGGYTVMELAGGRTNMAAWLSFCSDHREACAAPPEFPDLNNRIEAKAATDPEFRTALRRSGDNYRDDRVRAVVAIAPSLSRSFTATGLSSVSIPVLVVAGSADPIAPSETDATYYAQHTRGAHLEVIPGAAHYTFLDVPTERARRLVAPFAVDPPGVDREAVHARAAQLTAEFFETNLRPR